MSRFRTINLWKYWGETKDFTLIAVDLHDSMIRGGGRIVFFNVGILWSGRS